ncbi:MAG: response regulator transcription factor [Lachnospiraceae bacterium]
MYNLLIVEDENLVRRGIKTLVDYKTLGINEIFEAENGKIALELFEKETIHLIFADINMPKMNGLDFSKKVKELDPTVKIALITGYDYFEYALTALKIGIDDYILKPISKDDVTELLIKLIEKRKEADGISSIQKSAELLTQNSSIEEVGFKKTVIDEIRKNINNTTFSLSTLADLTGYNTTYLSTLFKKNFGMNFRDYLLDTRLEHAKILLLSSSMKNYEISQAIGIEDANYFSACFKRKFGVTVSEFRSLRGMI